MRTCDDLTVLILAGGRGTRLMDLYPDVPKPLIPVAGKPFLHWLTRWIAVHGPKNFVYSTGYRAEQIAQWVASSGMPRVRQVCCAETTPLGTGGAIVNALADCGPWTMVVNGDSLIMRGIEGLLALREQNEDGGLIGIEVADSSRYGSLDLDENGLLRGFREKVQGRGIINSGAYLFRTAMLRELLVPGPQSLEYDVFPKLLHHGARLRVLPLTGAPFIDIGTPETVAQAEDFVRTHFPSLDTESSSPAAGT